MFVNGLTLFEHKINFLLFFSVHVVFSLVCNSSTSRPQVMLFLVPEKNRVSEKPCIMVLVKTPKICAKSVLLQGFWSKIHIKSTHLQGFWSKSAYLKYLDPIQTCVSARSAHLEAAYLEALLYFKSHESQQKQHVVYKLRHL